MRTERITNRIGSIIESHSAGEHDPERARPRKFWRLIDGPLKRPIDQTLRFRRVRSFLAFFCGRYRGRKKMIFFFWFGRSWFGRSVGENLGRWRKSRPFAKISAVCENLGRSRKSRTLAKISDVGENLGRWRKSRPLIGILGRAVSGSCSPAESLDFDRDELVYEFVKCR